MNKHRDIVKRQRKNIKCSEHTKERSAKTKDIRGYKANRKGHAEIKKMTRSEMKNSYGTYQFGLFLCAG